MRLIHLQTHKAIYLVWSADFFLLAACIILSDRSPIGKVNGKSSVNNNCAKRIYQPAIQKANAQAPAACRLLSVNLSKKKICWEETKSKPVRGVVYHTFSILAPRAVMPWARTQYAAARRANVVVKSKNMKTKTILVRREQTKNIADAIDIKRRKNAKLYEVSAWRYIWTWKVLTKTSQKLSLTNCRIGCAIGVCPYCVIRWLKGCRQR